VNVDLGEAFLDALVRVGKMGDCDRALVVCADPPPLDKLKAIKKKIIFAVTQHHLVPQMQEQGFDVVALPGLTSSRMDRLKAALVGAVSAGFVSPGENVLCAMTHEETDVIDSLLHLTAGEIDEERTSLAATSIASDIPPQLLEVLVDLALRIGREGYEGRAIGTLIVVGDSTHVMEKSHPLTLNPFQGYSEVERNLFDAHVRDALRTFAMLDGAFVVRDDGVVLAAGRHMRVGENAPNLPLGLGARHTAAASISNETDAVAIVVSQSSGVVRVYQNGEVVLDIEPAARRAEEAVGSDGDEGRGRTSRSLPVVAPKKKAKKKKAKKKDASKS
jgi:DNA integrity scanning protein DisA with diadenylate cyclase activity